MRRRRPKLPALLNEVNQVEFQAEGEMTVMDSNGVPCLLLDDSLLSELVGHHFHARYEDGVREIGKVKVLIIPMRE